MSEARRCIVLSVSDGWLRLARLARLDMADTAATAKSWQFAGCAIRAGRFDGIHIPPHSPEENADIMQHVSLIESHKCAIEFFLSIAMSRK